MGAACRVVAAAACGVLTLVLATACGGASSSPGIAGGEPGKANVIVGAVPAESGAAQVYRAGMADTDQGAAESLPIAGYTVSDPALTET